MDQQQRSTVQQSTQQFRQQQSVQQRIVQQTGQQQQIISGGQTQQSSQFSQYTQQQHFSQQQQYQQHQQFSFVQLGGATTQQQQVQQQQQRIVTTSQQQQQQTQQLPAVGSVGGGQQTPTFASNDQAALYYSQQQHNRIQQQTQQLQYPQPAAPPILVQQNNQPVLIQNISANPPSPPVFQEVFKSSRFALGQNATFEGRITGWPKPTVTWLRKDLPLPSSNKHFLKYDEHTGKIILQINQIGPDDVGEYTCIARNQFGEAICTVNIQPEMFQQAAGQRAPLSPTYKSTNVQPQMILYPMSMFKVDTFEYRLLREIEYRQNLTRRYQDDHDVYVISPPSTQPGPPRVIQRQRNLKLIEGDTAQFIVKLEGVNTKVIWFRDGVRLRADSRLHVTTPDINTVCFTLEGVKTDEAGFYTCFAENPWGCVVASNELAVEKRTDQTTSSSTSRSTLSKTVQSETITIQQEQSQQISAPSFTSVPASSPSSTIEIEEGKLLRLDCRVSGRPVPEVAWYLNDQLLVNNDTHKILVNEQGSHSLMIMSVSRNHSGILTCVAKNKNGDAKFKLNINVIEKEQVVAPKFVERFSTISVKEGEPVTLSARAVGNPVPVMSWQKDGVAVEPGYARADGPGASSLEIPAAKLSHAGWYQCMAQNSAGSTATRARLFVEKNVQSHDESQTAPWRLNLPKPQKVIEPEKPEEPEVIYLRHVERARQQQIRREEPERQYDPPVFVIPLKDMTIPEGGRAVFEGKVYPVGDPTLKVEWYKDNKPLALSARINTTYRFGFILLEIIGLSDFDQGVYTCVISSATGSAESSATLLVQARESRYSTDQSTVYAVSEVETQSMASTYQELPPEPQVPPPQFIKQLSPVSAAEGRTAQFEAQLNVPVDRVEWYKDNRILNASSRITTISNFCYLKLNIMQLRAETDSGMYTVKVWNKSGEAVSSAQLVVEAIQQQRMDENAYMQSIEQLEAYKQVTNLKQEIVQESYPAPQFKPGLVDQIGIREGGFCHFEARLEPSDPSMKVEWLKDGKPVEASSRITSFYNFSYCALTIKQVTIFDQGRYTVTATNMSGSTQSSATLQVLQKQDAIQTKSVHPEGLEKIQYLEQKRSTTTEIQEEVKQPPRFITPMKCTSKIREHQRAHFEIRLEPQSDNQMTITWLKNGQPLEHANRIQMYHDFGYVALDINAARLDDTGIYTCVARNAVGEARIEASMEVFEVVQKEEQKALNVVSKASYEQESLQQDNYVVSAPVFLSGLKQEISLYEGQNIHLESRVDCKSAYSVDWMKNGKVLTIGSRYKTYNDFNFVCLDIIGAQTSDTGTYTVVLSNRAGQVQSSSNVTVQAQKVERQESSHDMEIYKAPQRRVEEEEVQQPKGPPVFTKPLKNIQTIELTNVHLETRLSPALDETMTVQWFFNSVPIPSGHCWRPSFEFDYCALDILCVYTSNSGVYTCQATNACGSASVSCTVNVISRQEETIASMDKLQYLEDSSHLSRSVEVDESVRIKPRFLTKPKDLNLKESQSAHFECRVEPSNVNVEWFKGNQPLQAGSRFKPICDFGFCGLQIFNLIEDDSGVYTARATNALGSDAVQVKLNVQSGKSIIQSSQVQLDTNRLQSLEERGSAKKFKYDENEASIDTSSLISEATLQSLQYLEQKNYRRSGVYDEVVAEPPMFTVPIRDVHAAEMKNVHFESRLVPVSDPSLRTEWFKNDVLLQASNRISTVHDFGFVSLDIKKITKNDEGVYTCRATNNLGQALASARLTVGPEQITVLDNEDQLQKLRYLEDKSQYDRRVEEEVTVRTKPVFITELHTARAEAFESGSMHLEARIEPYPDNTMKITWEKDGQNLLVGSRFKPIYDFGFAALGVTGLIASDSGIYTCRATNAFGEATSSCEVKVTSFASLQLDTQHADALEKIHQLESHKPGRKEEVSMLTSEKPQFVRPLRNVSVAEGQPIHLEGTLLPIHDATLKVEWFRTDGKPIPEGHRFRTTHDFGFCALDILYAYPEDSCTYSCKATNVNGSAVTTAQVQVAPKPGMLTETLDADRYAKIQAMEAYAPSKPQELESKPEKPVFLTPLNNVENAQEGDRIHMESRLTPINDSQLKVEWYVNGVKLKSGHRFRTTHDFGFCSLDVLYAYPEDSGTYQCKAVNLAGEAVNACTVSVVGKQGIYYESQHPEGWAKIRDLESYKPQRTLYEPELELGPPTITPLVGKQDIFENSRAHFECRVEPSRDPKMKVEWFKDGEPLNASNRFHTTFDFGYLALDIQSCVPEDSGNYKVRATNEFGSCETDINLRVVGPGSTVISDTDKPLEKFAALENRGPVRVEQEVPTFQKPVFTVPLENIETAENQNIHMEARLIPVSDGNLRVEWFRNEVPIAESSRIKKTHDFGYVALDIQGVRDEDQGIYHARAKNLLGEAVTTASLKIATTGVLDTTCMHPDGLAKIQQLENRPSQPARTDQIISAPPVFTRNLENFQLTENQTLHMEAFVEPKNDPKLRVSWFKSGLPLNLGSRMRTTFDFGLVTLDINGLRADDSAIYTCVAKNDHGEATTTGSVKVQGSAGIQSDSLCPGSIPKIQELEAPAVGPAALAEPQFGVPLFLGHLNDIEVEEGKASGFSTNVEPWKDPKLKLTWTVNGRAFKAANRSRTLFEFGKILLEFDSTFRQDEGVYILTATNAHGSAQTTGKLKVIRKDTGILGDTIHPKGAEGLERVQEVEGELQAKGRKPREQTPELPHVKPYFDPPLPNEVKLKAGQPLNLECRVEPKSDPELKVEYFVNGKPLSGTRYKTTFDFGYVNISMDNADELSSGVYTAHAYNKWGEAFTSCTVHVDDDAKGVGRETQHPKGEAGLEKIQEIEAAREKGKGPKKDDGKGGVPPKFTTPFENLRNLQEGDLAHIESNLTPIGDDTMKVEWYKDGKPIDASSRIRTVYAFGMVVLEIFDAKVTDNGIYTCKATNNWGKDEISTELECVVASERVVKPKFTVPLKNLENIPEFSSVHMEATLIPIRDENMEVEWYHNGKILQPSSRVKTVYDFGYCVLDIGQVTDLDEGTYECRARNLHGSDKTSAILNLIRLHKGVATEPIDPDAYARILELEAFGRQKPDLSSVIKLQPPKFLTDFENAVLVEGQSCHFESRLIPLDDPELKVTFWKDGIELRSGHKFRTFHDFGIVILDVLYCYAEDSGIYECRAENKLGKDVTRATLSCTDKASLIFDPQIPKSMFGAFEKIRNLEDKHKASKPEDVKPTGPPQFIIPLENATVIEGDIVHLETRLTGSNPRVEWWKDGKPLRAANRFKMFHDFGFVILEFQMTSNDQGQYECRAYNDFGEAVTTCNLVCSGKRSSLILDSQLGKMGLDFDKIAKLEGVGQAPRDIKSPEVDDGMPPELEPLSDMEVFEGSLAHIETRLKSGKSQSVKIEWLHNGRGINQGSRTKTISDFGFAILEISCVTVRESGKYTVRATNAHGTASAECNLIVKQTSGHIVTTPQLPGNFRSGTESLQKLEESLWKREEQVSEEQAHLPPRFITEIQDVEVSEGQPASFHCRLEPVNCPQMQVSWYYNGKPILLGSRMHTSDDFSFVSLSLDWTYARDSGEYLCRAVNPWGFATTRAKLTCKGKRDIVLESQLPKGLDPSRLNELERGPVKETPVDNAGVPEGPPKFVKKLTNFTITEGEPVFLEAMLESKTDHVEITWLHNSKPLKMGSRFQTVHDFGYVRLEILYTYEEDAGVYTCIAKNIHGEDRTECQIICKSQPTIVLQNQIPSGMKKNETLISMEAAIKKYTSEVHLTLDDIYDPDKKQPPRFVTQIQSKTDLKEMEAMIFESQLSPVGDPHLKVEWYWNSKPLLHKNRLEPIYDFGYTALRFKWVYPEDSGEYVCVATNLYGRDETRATIKTTGKPSIIYDSQLPPGMHSIDKIRDMEANWLRRKSIEESERAREAPAFVTRPETVEVWEGDKAKFCCRVTGYPRPRVLWIVNGKTVVNGSRYKLTYDGMWHLEILKSRQFDMGKVEVLAKNSLGEAYACTELIVKNRHDDYRALLKNSPRPWYDLELKSYQDTRYASDLEKVFAERLSAKQTQVHVNEQGEYSQKIIEDDAETEWQKMLKARGLDYSKIKELEESQLTKEQKIRELNRQHAAATQSSLTRTAAKAYDVKVDEAKQAILEHAKQVTRKEISNVFQTAKREEEERTEGHMAKLKSWKSDDNTLSQEEMLRLQGVDERVERGVEERVQKQVQKSQEGDLEVTRKITETEKKSTESKEKVIQGAVKAGAYKKAPLFTRKLQPCRVQEKAEAKFEVEFDGDPKPTIKWFREDFPIQDSGDFQISVVGKKSTLVIKEVFMEDSGVFSVIAENPGGQAKCSANLVVEEPNSAKTSPPYFVKTLDSKKVNVGAPLTLDCVLAAGAKPIEKVFWIKDGKKVLSDARVKITAQDNRHSLTIKDATVSDSGKYAVVGINAAGEARCECEVVINAPVGLSQPKQTSAAKGQSETKVTTAPEPLSLAKMPDVNCEEGESATFQTEIIGFQPEKKLKVQWFRENALIPESEDFEMMREADVLLLLIKEVFLEDSGVFRVKVTDLETGKQVETSAKLTVKSK